MQYLKEIESKLVVELSTSLSDAELDRCLNDTVVFLNVIAKIYRDEGFLNYTNIAKRIESYKLTY